MVHGIFLFYRTHADQSTKPVPNMATFKKWEPLVIKISNHSKTPRTVVRAASSHGITKEILTNAIGPPIPPKPFAAPAPPKPFAAPAPVNIVVPQPHLMLKNATIPLRIPSDPCKTQMLNLFRKPCFQFLNGKECGPTCKFNHALPHADEIFQKFTPLSNEKIMYMYSNFVVRSNISFITYFKTMCEIFGFRKMEVSLLDAIKDCERRSLIPFFKLIFNGLLLTGLSKRDALTRIINHCDKSQAGCHTVILEIIIETDALYFIDLLKTYYQQGTLNSNIIGKLVQQVIDNPAPTLVAVFIDILSKYSQSNICDIHTLRRLAFNIKDTIYATGDIILSEKFNEIVSRFQ